MFPVRCACMNNPMMLGGLGSIDDIVNADPQVFNAKMSLDTAKSNLDQAKSAVRGHPGSPHAYTIGKRTRAARRGASRRYSAALKAHKTSSARFKVAQGHYDTAKKNYESARKKVLERISNAIPYKGHVIKPKIEGDTVWYHVTLNISGKAGKHRTPEEAKAAVDNEVALGPGGLKAKDEFETAAKEVGEAKAAEKILADRAAAEQQAAPMPTAPVEKTAMSTPVKLGIAAAAVGGAVLLMR